MTASYVSFFSNGAGDQFLPLCWFKIVSSCPIVTGKFELRGGNIATYNCSLIANVGPS